ncbi:MAG: methenyltetrahydromethanopterin cyclohydrolase [Chloroflexota bacterium]
MISVNRQAAAIVEEMIAQAETLGIRVSRLPGGARLLDLGLQVPGGLQAGKYLAEVCMGGLGQVTFLPLLFGDFWLPGLGVTVDQPAIGCMASQYAGWAIKRDKFFAMGSGPARALAVVEKLYEKLEYKDSAEVAILVLEGRQLPTEEVAGYIADKCVVSPANLTMLIAPTASLAGSIQISARVVETGLHKLVELGFDVRQVLSGYGTAPIAPVDKDDLHAIGRTNDCVLYGGQVYYTVRADDAELAALVERIPSSASSDYGQPFYRLFKQYGDFYKIDPLLFSPAQVIINNVASGKSYRAGRLNAQVLGASLLGLEGGRPAA